VAQAAHLNVGPQLRDFNDLLGKAAAARILRRGKSSLRAVN
jgi:hypothetical protein